jgi:CubicO group peptidase (beta-lactamase class C family)
MARRGIVAGFALLLAVASLSVLPRDAVAQDSTEDWVQLESFLRQLVDSNLFSGVAQVALHGETVFSFVAGTAVAEDGVAVTSDTRFNLASNGKVFTAVAVAQLVESGRLSYEDPVIRHLPDYPNRDVAGRVTVHQLLTHTSGLGDYLTPEFVAQRTALRSLRDYLPLFAGDPLLFEPGAAWWYSNAGYIVLGLIVEAVSGTSYYEYVQTHVFDPAGLADTGFYDPDEAWGPELARGYMTENPEAVAPTRREVSGTYWEARGSSAGGAWSTAADQLRFVQALQDGRLLSGDSYVRLTTGSVRFPLGSYAYGLAELERQGDRYIGHSGSAPGALARLEIHPETGHAVVVLQNDDSSPMVQNREEFHDRFWRLVPRAPSARPDPVPREDRPGLAGTYLTAEGDTVVLAWDGAWLVASADAIRFRRRAAAFPILTDAQKQHASGVGRQVATLFSALAGGDSSPLEAAVPRGMAQREASFWSRTLGRWTDAYGPYRGLEVLGSAPAGAGPGGEDLLGSWIALQFERGERHVLAAQDMISDVIYLQAFPWPAMAARWSFAESGADEYRHDNHFLGTHAILRPARGATTDPIALDLDTPAGSLRLNRIR